MLATEQEYYGKIKKAQSRTCFNLQKMGSTKMLATEWEYYEKMTKFLQLLTFKPRVVPKCYQHNGNIMEKKKLIRTSINLQKVGGTKMLATEWDYYEKIANSSTGFNL